MLWIVLAVAAYSVALAWVYGRGGHRGVLALNVSVVLILAAGGVFVWPGSYGSHLSAGQRLSCDATVGVAIALLVMLAGWLALRVANDRTAPFISRWIVCVVACAVATIPSLLLGLFWGVGVLGCDTL